MEAHPTLPAGARAVHDPDDPREFILGMAVREDGTVLRFRRRWGRWVVCPPERRDDGRRYVVMIYREQSGRRDHKRRSVGVASLVLRAFKGPRPIYHEPLHYPDPNPSNNHINNLR